MLGIGLDVHLRRGDKLHVYCGGTRLVEVRWKDSDRHIRVDADPSYKRQPCAGSLFNSWNPGDSREFTTVLHAYLDGVAVDDKQVQGEGELQFRWSRVFDPWIPFDREAVLESRLVLTRNACAKLRNANEELSDRIESDTREWQTRTSNSKRSGEIDQLAVDPNGRLVLVELKDTENGSGSVYYAPFQLLRYVWEWYCALDSVREELNKMIDARKKLNLTSCEAFRVEGGLRAAVCFGADRRSREVRRRYCTVLEIANRHLPEGVPPIETWVFDGKNPVRL